MVTREELVYRWETIYMTFLNGTTAYPILTGVCSYLLFNRKEPTVGRFLAIVSALTLVTYSRYVSVEEQKFLPAGWYTAKAVGNFLLGLVASIIVYRLSPWHPLATYPGPTLAKVTKWYMSYWIARGDRHILLQRLHAKYGPWLRIGPNEISVNATRSIRPIYGQMFRAPFYQGAPAEADALITTTNRIEHAKRLIAWGKAFSSDVLPQYRHLVENRTNQLLNILDREVLEETPINLSHWTTLWAMDNMGDMSFSGGFETMAAGKDPEGWMEVLSIGVLFVGILGQVPWMRNVIALLPQPGPIVTFNRFMANKVLTTRTKKTEVKLDILGIIQDEGSGGPPLTEKEAASDASFMVVAGFDTVSQAVTVLLRHLAGNTVAQDKLRDEFKSVFEDGEHIDHVILAKLPYLDACIQESLRIVPPVPSGPPRFSDKGCQVLDRFIPAHTTVACPTYTLHRDPQNFKDPEEWKPERWLKGSTIQPHVHEAFVPFSYGAGVCIGKPVALHNMKYLTLRLLQRYRLSFDRDFDAKKFDSSYREHNLWIHDSLFVKMTPL